jgi:DNA polymerase-1
MENRNLFDKKESIILGYKFVPVEYTYTEEGKKTQVDGATIYPNYMFIVEGMSPKLNVRNAFMSNFSEEEPENSSVTCSIDFSGQELRLAANFSHEQVWMNAFKTGGDVHKETALSVFGKETYDKEKRKLAKAVNFSIIYGAEALSYVGLGKSPEKPRGMTFEEAEEFLAKYKAGLPSLISYQDRLVKISRQKGTVYTFFGRPRRVDYYFKNRMAGFGKRTILNSPIQGTAGDVLKRVMKKLWDRVLNHPDYKNDVRFLSTVHDEINYSIKTHRLMEIAKILEDTMYFPLSPDWEVPLTVEVSFGWSWGSLFSFVWDSETSQYKPKKE